MTPRKFIEYILNVENKLYRWTLGTGIILFLTYFIYTEYPFDFESHAFRYIVIASIFILYLAFWMILHRSINRTLHDKTNKRIAQESDELVDLMVRNKVRIPCGIHSILESMDKIEMKNKMESKMKEEEK